MNPLLKLLAIMVSVFLMGFFLEEMIDSSGLNNPQSLEETFEIISELFSVFVALSIFTITWYAYNKSRDNHSLFLGTTFLITGLLILFHLLSYPFMPDFFNPNSSHKSAVFFLESRFILAFLLLASIFVHKDSIPKLINKYVLILFTIAILSISLTSVFFQENFLFVTFDLNSYSTATIFLLFVISIIIFVAGYLYTKRAQETGQNNFLFITYGSIIVLFSNLVYFSYEFSGHFLIITGFFYFYLAMYRSSVELPYEKLAIAEEKLRKGVENKYITLFDNANDAIITTDLEYLVTSWNRSAVKLFGWEAYEVMGKKLSSLIVPLNLQTRGEGIIRDTVDGKSAFGIETEKIRKDGSMIFVSLTTSQLLDSNHNLTGLSFIIRDVTERKRAEKTIEGSLRRLEEEKAKTESIIAAIGDAISIQDTDFKVLYQNKIHQDITGDQKGEYCYRKYEHGDHICEDCPVEMSFKDGKIHTQERSIIIREQKMYFEITASPLRDSTGNIVAGIEVGRNITERKKAEDQIAGSLHEKETLLKEIHHRVKNNLQIVSSLLDHQTQYIKDNNVIHIFKDSQNRIASMALVHEKLYQSKDLAKINFHDYINDLVANLFQSFAENSGKIRLNLNIENIQLDIDFAIPCGLIINELVTNSLKYAFPEGRPGEIKIVFRKTDEDMLELIIGDNGIGIPSDLDFRKSGSMGLHLVTILAENQLHGKINLNRNEGTEFKIEFKGIK
jgi:PAS domain S-box-containing protein